MTMYTPQSDYDAVRSIVRTRKQREAAITVGICAGLFVATLVLAWLF